MVVLHNFYVYNYVWNSRYDLKNYVHFAFQRIFFAKTMLFGYLLMVKKLCMLLLMILKSKVLDGKSMEMVTMLVWIHTQEKLLWDIPRYTHTARLKCEKSCLDKFWNYRSKNRHFLIRGECISLLFGAIILHNLFISFISSILCLLPLLLHSIVVQPILLKI